VAAGTTTITATQAAVAGVNAQATQTYTLTVNAGLISTLSSGGLTWTSNNSTVAAPGYTDWATANATCAALTQGGFTWRLPTQAELSALYTAGTGALTTAGWPLNITWSSTGGAGFHDVVSLGNGFVIWYSDSNVSYVSCVH
jgi:formylglycine-generating enzyme required for sulfatase activity